MSNDKILCANFAKLGKGRPAFSLACLRCGVVYKDHPKLAPVHPKKPKAQKPASTPATSSPGVVIPGSPPKSALEYAATLGASEMPAPSVEASQPTAPSVEPAETLATTELLSEVLAESGEPAPTEAGNRAIDAILAVSEGDPF